MKIVRVALALLICWWVCLGVGTAMGEAGLWFINNVLLVYRIQTITMWVATLVGLGCLSFVVYLVWWLSLPGERCTWFDHKPE